MKSKTTIKDMNKQSTNQLENLTLQQMPNLQLTDKAGTPTEIQALMENNIAQQIFVNIDHITSKQFMQLKQMKQSSFSMLLITTTYIDERLNQIPKYLVEHQSPKKLGIELRVDGNIQFISYEKIIRLEACSNYTKIYITDSAKPILTSRTLKFYFNQLDSQTFLRPHQSHLVNKNFIEKLSSNMGWIIVLSNGERISIARRKVKAIRNRLQLAC